MGVERESGGRTASDMDNDMVKKGVALLAGDVRVYMACK